MRGKKGQAPIQYATIILVIVALVGSWMAYSSAGQASTKELSKNISRVKNRIDTLEKRIKSLEKVVSSIKKRIGVRTAKITVQSIDIPNKVKVGEEASIRALVKNGGKKKGSKTIRLEVAGEVRDRRKVTLKPGEMTEIDLKVTMEKAGSYDIAVGSQLGTLNVGKIGKGVKVVVGSKRFTEQYILGNMLAELIDARTACNVVRKIGLGGTATCQSAIRKGKIDVFPSYSGTAYMTVLKKEFKPGTSPDEIYQTVKKEYKKKYDIIWLGRYGFNNTYCICVTQEMAKKRGLKKVSDLKPYADDMTIAMTPEHYKRSDGYPGFKKKYFPFGKVKTMDPGLMYKALAKGKVDVIVGFATNGKIPYYNLKVLKDDKQFYPSYQCATIVRAEILEKVPELRSILNELGGKLPKEVQQKLNAKVDVHKKDPKSVARNFLIREGLIEKG